MLVLVKCEERSSAELVGYHGGSRTSVELITPVLDMFAALCRHDHEDNPLCKGSVGSPCMYFGGGVGDQTTQSMAVEFPENGQIHLWVTGRSTPCISMSKPFAFGNEPVAPVYAAGDERARKYWIIDMIIPLVPIWCPGVFWMYDSSGE